MRKLDAQVIEDIAVGAAVLGTGGGGDPYVGMLMALQAVNQQGPVDLISCDELDDDALIVPVAMMGAPTVLIEKVPSGEELIAAFDMIQEHLDRKITATMPIEAGGVNSMIPFVVASQMGLPVVDVDAMGRHLPRSRWLPSTSMGSVLPLWH